LEQGAPQREAIDRHFAVALTDLARCREPLVLETLELLMSEARAGSICLELGRRSGQARTEAEAWPDPESWARALHSSGLVGDGSLPTPLVLDAQGRLYLRRAWQDEAALARELSARSVLPPLPDPAALAARLERLFPPWSETGIDWQRAAAALAFASPTAVIAGGPGTGKTTTVVRVLALLLEAAQAEGSALPRCLLLAPTGKAAARLAEATARARDAVPAAEEIRQALPTTAATLHRALGLYAGATVARRGRDNPLPAEIVVVDEASMIDGVVMRRLVEAVAPSARLLLLGDAEQLASVEAGSVLGELCSARLPSERPELRGWLSAVLRRPVPQEAALDEVLTVATLRRSHRFDPKGGIGALVFALRDGDWSRVEWALGQGPEVDWRPLSGFAERQRALLELGRRGYSALFAANGPEQALAALERFRLLAAHREGQLGVQGLNEALSTSRAGRLSRYCPLLITENQPQLELFNGDVGVAELHQGRPIGAWFPSSGAPRRLGVGRLPPWEPSYAMTVHKSQGSEFEEVVIALPEPGSPLLTREWLYTAVSRAKRRVTLVGELEALRQAVAQPTRRGSGLGAKLVALAKGGPR